MKRLTLRTIKFLNLIAFAIMIFVNLIFNLLGIGGGTTGEVSAKYENLFTPAGLTFSIWGIIYLLLFISITKLFLSKKDKASAITRNYSSLFITSCVFNILWIVSWHFNLILVSMVMIALLLFSLFKLFERTRGDSLLNFSIGMYLGWILFATIANAFVLASYLGLNMMGSFAYLITTIVIVAGSIISGTVLYKKEALSIGVSGIIALLGIMFKHITTYDSNFIAIVIATIVGLIIISTYSIRLYNKHYLKHNLFLKGV